MMSTLLFTQLIKSFASLAMAFTMAMSSTLTGPLGEYEKLAIKATSTDPAKTETQIEIMVDLEAIFTVAGQEFENDIFPEIPGVYKDGKIDTEATIYTFTDSEEAKIAVSLGKSLEDGCAIYIDEDGLAVTPALVDKALASFSVINEDAAELYGVYKEYFADNGFYLGWNEALGISEYINDEETTALMGIITEAVNDVVTIISKEDNIAALGKIIKPIIDPLGKYYKEDGDAYSMKMNGVQLIEYSADIMEIMYTEEMANNIYDYFLGLVDDVDYIKYFDLYKSVAGDESLEGMMLPAGTTNETVAVMIKAYLEGYRADFVEGYTSAYTEEAGELLDMVAAGKSEDAEVAVMLNTLYPFLENSYLEASISEKNGVIVESTTLTIANKEMTFAKLAVSSGIAEYNEALPATKDVIPFDKRVEAQELDNKLGFKVARENGVHSVEISWDADMTPDDAAPEIAFPMFAVNYNSSMIESIKNDPAFATLTDEQKELILGMYADSDYESKYCSSSAHLIDGSVYLPLRQIMENCGYEVSWDGEARKAYVTVDGKKIEMTGVIVSDRTYVKIRDFEKLGATVEYEEDMYREDAYNDFSKFCYVTITFAK